MEEKIKKEEMVILVDEQDNQIGLEEKLKAHKLGLLHSAFSVFLFCKENGETKLLLQQRAKHKYHCSCLWANTCCSHPREGENIIEAGKRRLQEEMGITVDTLTEIGTFKYKADFSHGLTEHEIDHVLIGSLHTCDIQEIPFNKDEVEAIKWVSLQELKQEFEQNPDIYTPWFSLAFARIKREEIENLFTEIF